MSTSELRALVSGALDAARTDGVLDLPPPETIELSRPARREHGDFSTNVALVLQKAAGRPPREVAQAIMDRLPASDWVRKTEIAGPGFINFFLTEDWLHEACRRALDEAARFGANDSGAGLRVNVEFVSINPTGPLHVGSARNAVLGDSVARMLSFTGHEVTREYYFNDAGERMDRFGASVAARYLELAGRAAEFPEDGYHGAYVYDLARRILEDEGQAHVDVPFDELTILMRDRAYPIVIAWIEEILDRFDIHFDVWTKERDLIEAGRVDDVVQQLRDKGLVFADEGAEWLRTTDLGDSRDRVLVKSDGSYPYLAPDLAYHVDKVSRGFDRMIVVLGADHHGQVPSLHAGMKALGVEPARIEVLLHQMILMYRAGEQIRMSRRAGDLITLAELADEVGVDAARYTLLRTSADHDVRFDIEEVKKQTMDNPVYYVQYAHARAQSILERSPDAGGDPDWSLLAEEAENELMRAISEFPELVELAVRDRAPHRVAGYAEELARRFHRFYTDCRVVGEDAYLTLARLALTRAAQQVLRNALALLGVTAPLRMERLAGEET